MNRVAGRSAACCYSVIVNKERPDMRAADETDGPVLVGGRSPCISSRAHWRTMGMQVG